MARTGHFFTTYAQEAAILRTPERRAWLAVLLAFAAALPWLVGPYYIHIANQTLITVMAAVGLMLLTGFTGQISLAHGSFVAVGAYTTAALAVHLGWPFYLTLPAAVAATWLVGIITGGPSLRLEGLYVALATMATHFIIEFLITSGGALTGGHRGLRVPPPELWGWQLRDRTTFYYVLLVLTIAIIALGSNIARSRTGRALAAVRDRDLAAAAMGIGVTRYKLIAFGLSAAIAGFAGGLYAYYVRSISPDHFPFALSIFYLAIAIAGGLGRIEGAVLGAIFLSALPELLRLATGALSGHFPMLTTNFQLLREGMYGLIIVLFLIAEPVGLWGIYLKAYRAWFTFPYRFR